MRKFEEESAGDRVGGTERKREVLANNGNHTKQPREHTQLHQNANSRYGQ